MQNMGKSVMRVAKNSIKGYSDTQTKVRDATSNDPWGPSGTQMSEIAALTFNQNDFVEIIEMLDKRLNDKGKNWRHVFKSLTLLDYCLHAGSENTVQYFRENLYIIKTLKEFQYIDEFGKDQGANVRQKAKDITNLLLDERRMRDQRKNREHMRDRMQGDAPRPAQRQRAHTTGATGRDSDMEAAIAASKRSAEQEAARGRRTQDEDDLERALRLSREEDEKRKRELAAQNGGSLFDDQQNNLIDVNAVPEQQPQMTGFQSYNPYAALQQQQMQEEYMRQQQMLQLQQQAEQQAQYQAMLQQQQQYEAQQRAAQEAYIQQQQQLAWQQQQYQQQQPLQPQPTAYGSNNPFAAFAPQQSQQQTAPPPLPQSNSYSSFQQEASPAPAPEPTPVSRPTTPSRKKDDGKHAQLAQMLAAGYDNGVDSFGNVGNMRFPVGSAFAQKTGSLQAQLTGAAPKPNPFTQQTQQHQQQQQQQYQQQQQNNNQPFFEI